MKRKGKRRTAMTMNDHRKRVDELDREIVRLLNRRAQMSIQLGQLKQDLGLPMRDDTREDTILRQVQRCNPGPFDEQALTAIYRALLEESRRVTAARLTRANEQVSA
jgi:chorismate mutase